MAELADVAETPKRNWEEWGGHWFLSRLLRKLLKEFRSTIVMGGLIEKEPLYRCMSWWFRCNRLEAREALTFLAKAFHGIDFGPRGLRISPHYLEREKWLPCAKDEHPRVLTVGTAQGGETDEVG